MHAACIKKFFGTATLPVLDYTTEQLDQLALQIIQDQTSLAGVQPKLSLHLNEHEGSKRLAIVGLWGGYICKPQTLQYEMMPEVEDLTMHLAEVARIEVVSHTLMRMADDTLCYLTRRIDRTSDGEKIAMEDMCQLTERQTEHKYKSSYERVGKAVLKYSSLPKMDVTNFFELVLFSWLIGNAVPDNLVLKSIASSMMDAGLIEYVSIATTIKVSLTIWACGEHRFAYWQASPRMSAQQSFFVRSQSKQEARPHRNRVSCLSCKPEVALCVPMYIW